MKIIFDAIGKSQLKSVFLTFLFSMPLLPSTINLDTSLEQQALQLSSNLLGGSGASADLAKAEAKVGKV
jgi:hypothetical protein